MSFSFIVVNFFRGTGFLFDRFLSFFYKKCMKSCGRNVLIRPSSSDFKGLENLSIGDHVLIPKRAVIYCTGASLTIGNKVVFGPCPTIMTGDHRIDVTGKFIIDVNEKSPENDAPVVVEDDVWIGANVTILKGVTIGRGSVIAAGAVVNKSCKPYSIIGGVPARLLKFRFAVDEVMEHEKCLYPVEKRYDEVFLNDCFS